MMQAVAVYFSDRFNLIRTHHASRMVYIALLLSIVFVPATTHAATETVFGPKVYERSNGAPFVVTESFTATEGQICFLKIYNGGMEDADFELVSSSVMTLNANNVAAPKEFNQHVAYIEKPVTLQASNTLDVEVRGKPGGAVVVVIECDVVINNPPTISADIAPPANAKGWHNVDATVSFNCADPDNDLVSCTDPITLTTEGENQFVVGAAVDSGDNRTEMIISISIDKTLPTIQPTFLTQPNLNSWYNTDVSVDYACTDTLSGVETCAASTILTTDGLNQVISGSVEDVAGNSSSTTSSVSIDKIAPTISASVSPVPNSLGWNASDVTVSFTCDDALSGIDTCPAPIVVTTDDANQEVTGTAIDIAGNSASATVVINIDSIVPAITSAVVPAPNAAGWNNTNATVNFSCFDAGSGVANCPSPQIVTLEGANQIISGTVTDLTGNSALVSVSLNIDKTVPSITASVTPAANVNGWNSNDVTVTFTCNDTGSGIATCPTPITVSTEGAGQNVNGTAIDLAGNTATTNVTLNIDKTIPSIDTTTVPAVSAGGWVNTDVTVNYSCTDALSGIANCPASQIVSSRQTVNAQASDMADNQATTSLLLNIDKTVPTITASFSQAPNASGWHTNDVTVTFTCSDAESGISTCPAPITVTTEGAAQVITGTAIDGAGNTASTNVTLNIDKSVPTISSTVTPNANASGWSNSDVTVSFVCQDTGAGVASCTAPITVTTEGANQIITGTVTDTAGNTTSTTVTVNLDKTVPSISASVSPAANAAGWHSSDVTVIFTCGDTGSGAVNCPAPQTITLDGANQVVTGTVNDAAGNTASTSVTLNIDKSAPTITASVTPTANAAGWYNADVTVSFTCSDIGGAVANCPSPQTVTLDGANQIVTGTVTDAAGNTASTSVTLNIDKTLPTITVTVTPTANAAGWYTTDVTVSFTCSDIGSTVANCPSPQTVIRDGANQVVTGTVTDAAGNTATTSVTLNIDKTVPTISATVTPTANAAGWNNTDVTINFTCADAGGVVANCPSPITVSTEGAAQVFTGTVLDSAGNSASTTVTLNIDKTPPAITSGVNQLPNAASWNNTDITSTFICLDNLSGVASCSDVVVTSTEGVNQTVTGTAVDVAGNVSTDSFVLNIDKTAPQISATSTPAANAAGWNNSDVSISFTCTDVGSGISDCPTPVVVSTEGAGQIINAEAFDVAGNSATASHTVNIDKTAPSISISNPLAGTIFTESAITVDGVVADAGFSPTVTVNGLSVVVNLDGSFSQALTLSEGLNDIVVIASDVAGNVSETNLQVTLNGNAAPQITSTPVAFVVEGDSWTYTLEATDPDGDNLSYSMSQSPIGAVFGVNSNTATWPTTGLAPGNYDFQFTVVDSGGLTVDQLVTIEILPAERTTTHEGTEFWIPVSLNLISDAKSTGGTFDINLVSNGTDTEATIEIPALSVVETLSLTANQMATYSINLDNFAATKGFTLNALLENYAIHITAASPISAYFVNQKASTTDGFLGLPAASLGQEYIAATYIMLGRLGILKTVDGGQLGAILTIVATEDNTQVIINPIMDILPGDQRQIEVGNPIELTMNRGDVYNLETKGSFKADLTGSMIKADKPISVLGQMECVHVPVGPTACDHLVEQLPPIESLATDYYTVPFWGRIVNTPFGSPERGDTFRVVAPYDNTEIYIDEVLRARLNQGDYYEYVANGPRHVRASHPVLMVQYSNGNQYDSDSRELPNEFTDPFMVIVPPAEQFLKSYTINTPARNLAYNYANLLVPTSAIDTVMVDGQSIDQSLFGEIPNSQFSYIQLPLMPGSHHIEAQEPFGTYVYGYDYFESYGYLGGMALSPARFVTSLSLSGEVNQTLDDQWCGESTVVDQSGRPVNGVRVKFNVAGVSNHDAYRFSDAHGVANYCYTANKAGVDAVTASLNQLTQSISIDWVAGTQNRAPVITSLPTLGVVDRESFSYNVVAEDPEGGELFYTLIEAPNTMSIDASGRIYWPSVYLSSNNFNRQRIVYSVTDPLGLETMQSFELSEYVAFNTPPEFKPATVSLTATLGVPFVYNQDYVQHSLDYPKYQVLVNDVDEDAAFVDILSGPAEAYMQRIIGWYTRISRPNDPRSCEGCIHYFRWVPQAVGEQPFVLGLRDARGGTAESLSFTVNVAPNLPPQIVDFNPQNIASVGYQYSYILNVDNDVPPHEFDNLDDLKIVFEQAPTGMRYELVGGNNTQELRIYWTPRSSDVGLNTIRLRVDDRLNSSSTEEFIINVIDDNQPPVIALGSMPNAEDTIPYQYQINATDPNGDALTYSLAIAPEGMTVNETTGVINWIPSTSLAYENEVVRVVVTDVQGLTAEKYNLLHIVEFSNRAPEFIPAYHPLTAKVGVEYVHQVEATDREGDLPISYRLSSSSSEPVIDQQNGTITWTPTTEGSFWLNIAATDSLGNFASRNSAGWYVQVLPDTASLDASLELAPSNIIDLGESVTLSILPENEATTPQVTLTVDGLPTTVDSLLHAQITPTRVGTIPVVVVITDGVQTITRTTTLFVRDPADITPPVVQINSPTNLADITAPTAIFGTAQDDNLVEVVLLYKRADQPLGTNLLIEDFVELYRGPGAFANEAIASLDTTMLVNGTYHILLQATDSNNLTAGTAVAVTITGDLKVGNFSFTVEDLNIPLDGIPVTVSRTYDSRRRDENLDFGYGWSIDYQNIRLEESDEPTKGWTQTISQNETFAAAGSTFNSNAICIDPAYGKSVTVTLPNGDTEKFVVAIKPTSGSLAAISDPNCYLASDRYYDLSFVAMSGTNSTLESMEGLSLYLSDTNNGYLSLVGEGVAKPISQYVLTTRSGYIYNLNQNYGITSIEDPNGNTVTYTNEAITHSSGKAITINRATDGRVLDVTDPTGKQIIYGYNTAGDLISVTNRDQSVITYTYNNNHGLLDILDPFGRQLVRNIYDNTGRLIAQEDGDGNRTDFNHDIAGRLSVVTNRRGYSTQYQYDDHGNVLSEIDALGNVTQYTFDADDNQLSKTDALGNTTTATYNAVGDQLTQTDALNNTVTFTYNDRGQELTIADANGNLYTNTYDIYGGLLSVTDPEGNVANSYYQGRSGLVSGVVDMLGHTTTYNYDTFRNKSKETDALGNVTTFTHDDNNNPITETRTRTFNGATLTETTSFEYDARDRVTKTTNALGEITEKVYDLSGNVIQEIDALGYITEYTFDAYGRLTQTTYPDASISTKTYDEEGNLTSETDRNGDTTQYTYDVLNRLTTTTYADNSTSQTEYDVVGRVIAEIDVKGNRTEHEYNASNQRIITRDALLNETVFTSDANGNLETQLDANNHLTTFEYDNLDRRIKTIYHDNTFTQEGYDKLGRVISKTDQAGLTTAYEYNALGQLTAVIDALNQRTEYTYDEAGNKLTQTDAKLNTTSWTYDAMGRVLSRTLPEGQSESFGYDVNGNQTSHTDFNGQTTSFVYDENDRLTEKRYFGNVETYTYDAMGNRISSHDTASGGTTTYGYDVRNRLTLETQPDGTQLAYGYDAAGNRTSVTTTLPTVPTPTVEATTYGYDILNRLETVTDNTNQVTTYGYDNVGNRASVSYPNGNTTAYVYDTLNRLTQVQTKDSTNAVISQFDYVLGLTGRRDQITDLMGTVTTYGYDDLYRLLREDITGHPVLGTVANDYQYDEVGNRTYATEQGVATAYSYDNNDRLLTAGGETYVYDDNGNTLTTSIDTTVTTNSYDTNNRLIQMIKTESGTEVDNVSYAYDLDGLRTAKNDDGVITNYVVDKNRDYAQVLNELDSSNMPTVSYVYGDDLIKQSRAANDSYYLYDGLGSTRALTDDTGQVTDTYDYSAYGDEIDSTGITENSYKYTGEQFDQNLGNYYLRARYYDPSNGRFTQQDSWMGDDYSPVTLHKYLYANVDPVNHVDPSGNFGLGSFSAAFNVGGVLATLAVPAVILTSSSYSSVDTGHAREYDQNASNYHFYEMETTICYTTNVACNLDNVFGQLRRFPAPGWDSSRMVNTGDVTQISIAYVSGGSVVHRVTPGEFTVRNTTLPGHIFEEGYVDRVVTKVGSQIKVQSIGEGINKSAMSKYLNLMLYRPGFNMLDSQIKSSMSEM